jgi:16S rRNA (uracil1498-N3)-methyltransferase
VTAPHFFVESLAGSTVRLSPADSRHALRALRLRPGESVTVADGRGSVAAGRVAGEEDGVALIDVDEVRRVARPSPKVSVAFAPPKGDRLAWAIQKLAEIGVEEAVLISTERSVRAWDQSRAARATGRLEAVAREAAMQSRQPFVMEVRAGGSLRDEVVTRAHRTVVLWESADARLDEVLPDDATGIRLLVGPEGGFAEDEVHAAVESGAVAASLGPSILRTETAAVVSGALVLARYGRLG